MDSSLQDTKFSQFSLLCVHYLESSPTSFLLSLSSIFPYIILYSLVLLICFQRHFQDVMIFLGLCVNELLNQILKRLIREVRPERVIWHQVYQNAGFASDNHSVTYGMPSSHAQFMSFFFFCAVFYYSNAMVDFRRDTLHQGVRWVMIIVAAAACLLVGFGRVHQEFHTELQIGMGFLVGMVFAWIWRSSLVWKRLLHFLERFCGGLLQNHFKFRDAEYFQDWIRDLDLKHYLERQRMKDSKKK